MSILEAHDSVTVEIPSCIANKKPTNISKLEIGAQWKLLQVTVIVYFKLYWSASLAPHH
jgi:hypothetical protein